jgi:hydroxymethylpyrimidine pyrophosphatase-like HAD family hydrolase
MGNADEAVKRHALAITASNDEDGVALAIQKYIL